MALDKVVSSSAEAVSDIGAGATFAGGGFGVCGIPSALIGALLDQGAANALYGSRGVAGRGNAEAVLVWSPCS